MLNRFAKRPNRVTKLGIEPAVKPAFPWQSLNSRNRTTLTYALILLTLLTAAFAVRSQVDENWQTYLEGHPDIHALELSEFRLSGSEPEFLLCDATCQSKGFPELKHSLNSWLDLNPLKVLPSPDASASSDTPQYWTQVQFTLQTRSISDRFSDPKAIIVALPTFAYRSLVVKLNGDIYARFYNNQRVGVRLTEYYLKQSHVDIDLAIELFDRTVVYRSDKTTTPPYLAAPLPARDFETFLVNQNDDQGALLGMMSRILIAFFALFLFAVIDSSPESFGLAVFLGFEAAALVLEQNWIKVPAQRFFIHYFYQMGDIFRLYFFLQISRVFRPNTRQWLLIGTALSIPYGLGRVMEDTWSLQGLVLIPRMRDLLVGTAGAVACVYTLVRIHHMRLPWRKAALFFGAACSVQQILGPLTHYYPEWNTSAAFRSFMNSYQAFAVYLGALSSLTNISTLENRVDQLSKAKVRSDLIEQELSLGQSVQQAFLSIEPLPPEFEITRVHEAAVYVSGDIYFVHWDEPQQRLVLLLCDHTGHGVQAALKATATYMLARSLWILSADVHLMRFTVFRDQLSNLMTLFSATPDLPTFAGVEFYPQTGLLSAYRANFNAPMIIEPMASGGWRIGGEDIPDGVVRESFLKPRSLIVLFSDGYISSSRHLLHLTKYLETRMAEFDGTPDMLKSIICMFDEGNPSRAFDDRTMLVLSWRQDHGATIQTKDELALASFDKLA